MYMIKQIPSEAQLKKYLRQFRFGKYIVCEQCKKRLYGKYKEKRRYWCKGCRRYQSLTSGSWLSGMKLPLQKWYALLYCWTKKIPIDQARGLSGCSQKTVRHWYEKFRWIW